jgi:hypothetical protein
MSLPIKICLVLALSGLLLAIIVPNYVRARTTRSLNMCIDRNLWLIADAKKRWAEANAKGPDARPNVKDLLPYLKGGKWLECPSGGKYEIGPVSERPTCSFTEHTWNLHPLAYP